MDPGLDMPLYRSVCVCVCVSCRGLGWSNGPRGFILVDCSIDCGWFESPGWGLFGSTDISQSSRFGSRLTRHKVVWCCPPDQLENVCAYPFDSDAATGWTSLLVWKRNAVPRLESLCLKLFKKVCWRSQARLRIKCGPYLKLSLPPFPQLNPAQDSRRAALLCLVCQGQAFYLPAPSL